MTNPITPEAVERLCRNLNGAEHALHDADLDGKASDVAEAATTLRALARELAEVKAERDALMRALDENWVTHQEVAQARSALATARTQIVAAQEDMKERAANVLDHHGYGYGAVARALGNRLCCDGNMCGCQGADVGSYLQYLIRALPLTDPADALAEHDKEENGD